MKAVTHDGEPYADDILSAAVLTLANPNIHIIRSRESSVINEADIIFDLGGVYNPDDGKFDHPQHNPCCRQDGRVYAISSLLWKEYGKSCIENVLTPSYKDDLFFQKYFNQISGYIIHHLDQELFRTVDVDNANSGQYMLVDRIKEGSSLTVGAPSSSLFAHNFKPFTLTKYLKSLSKTWYQEEEDEDEWFFDASSVARDILEDLIENAFWYQKARRMTINKVLEAQKGLYPNVLILDKLMPYKHFDAEEIIKDGADIQFVLYPTPAQKDDTWRLVGVDTPGSTQVKVSFPAAWGGLTGPELEKQSNCKGAIFCDKRLTKAVFKDKESALHVAKALVDRERVSARVPLEPVNLN